MSTLKMENAQDGIEHMRKQKKEQTLTDQIQTLLGKGVLSEETKRTINNYNELVRKGIVIKAPYYVDTSGFKQVRDQIVEQTER